MELTLATCNRTGIVIDFKISKKELKYHNYNNFTPFMQLT